MNTQTRDLFAVTPPATAPFVAPLLAAYTPTAADTILKTDLYPEPYYGDFNQCSIVLLTHNPGDSDNYSKGIGSPFETQIYSVPVNPETNYFSMASAPNFPNNRTNGWVNRWDTEIQNHFNGIQVFTNRVFIRDLIPFHSNRFGRIDMTLCSAYLYQYFFNQVIAASFNSELYHRINQKGKTPATIIYARGSAWSNGTGLGSIGWDRIGRIYSYCYVYKANFEKILKEQPINSENYTKSMLDHNVYIVVITPIRTGARYGIYSEFRNQRSLINLSQVIYNYDNIPLNNSLYISHNPEMDMFFDLIR